MKNARNKYILGLFIMVFLATGSLAITQKVFKDLPAGWKVEKTIDIPKDQLMVISKKLGARVYKLSNTYLTVNGQPLQVNIMHCRRKKSADKIYQAILSVHNGDTNFVIQKGVTVIELTKCNDMSIIKKANELFSTTGKSKKEKSEIFKQPLPIGWQINEIQVLDKSQTDMIANKLGANIENLTNVILNAHGQHLRINILEAQTPQDAAVIYNSILKVHKGFRPSVIKHDKKVIEISCEDTALTIKAGWELGFRRKPTAVEYAIKFDAAPIKDCDFMAWNKMFNLFLALNNNPVNEDVKSQINELSKKFNFDKDIQLRNCDNSKPKYQFDPIPTQNENLKNNEIIKYSFDKLNQKFGINYTSIEVGIKTNKNGFTPSDRKVSNELLAATAFWPVDAPKVKALANKITEGCNSKQEKVKAILKWLTPGANIKFGGPVTGSRYGVKKVLEQRYGHCWDFSDCFVTLCRASGIPCRQLAGWLYGLSGHVWAEVLYETKGWQQVDPTGGNGLKCGIYHIPYLVSEDGNMSILYLSMPKIDIVKP